MDTKALTGLHPARVYGSGANSTGIKKLPIASGDARDMFTGDLVKVSLGNIEPVSAAADYAVGGGAKLTLVGGDKSNEGNGWSMLDSITFRASSRHMITEASL